MFGLMTLSIIIIIRTFEMIYNFDKIPLITKPLRCKKCHKNINFIDCNHSIHLSFISYLPPLIVLTILFYLMFIVNPSSIQEQLIYNNMNHPEKPPQIQKDIERGSAYYKLFNWMFPQ